MKLETLCGGVKPSCPNLKSREAFIDGLFEAAGQKPYISVSYKRNLCNGTKPFTVEQKSPLRGRDNLQSLTAFFTKAIADTLVTNVIAAFGIPEKDIPDKNALCSALAHQMRLLIDSDDEDVSDILTVEYQKTKNAAPTDNAASQITSLPPYPGDSIYMKSKWRPVYSVGLDEIFEHTWVFDNVGTQTWTGRRLYFSNHDEVRPRADSNYIDIPDTPPNHSVRLTVRMDARSFEEKSECKWIMIDSEGKDCFPNSSQFTIVVDVTFQTGI